MKLLLSLQPWLVPFNSTAICVKLSNCGDRCSDHRFMYSAFVVQNQRACDTLWGLVEDGGSMHHLLIAADVCEEVNDSTSAILLRATHAVITLHDCDVVEYKSPQEVATPEEEFVEMPF